MECNTEPTTSANSERIEKLKRYKVKCWSGFSDYCSNASVDGLRYVTETGRHWIERLFWTLVILLSIYLGSYMVYSSWLYWKEFPVIITFSEKSTAISLIPFPAITICPQQKASKDLIDYTEVYHKMKSCPIQLDQLDVCNVTMDEYTRFLALTQVCRYPQLQKLIPKLNTSIDVDVIKVLEEINPFDDFLFSSTCKWANQSDCSSLLTKSITDSGICFTFNSLNADAMFRENNTFNKYQFLDNDVETTWSQEAGYQVDADRLSYPYRAFGAGRRNSFYIQLMNEESNVDYVCKGAMQGFNVQLHSPDEIPQSGRLHFRVPDDKEMLVSIKPQAISTSESLRSYDPNARQCYFSDEKYLRYFRVYNQNNCEIECIANYTLEKCGCAKFSFPATIDTRICTVADIACYRNAEEEVYLYELEENRPENQNSKLKSYKSCQCLPACNSLSFSVSVSQSNQEFEKVMTALKWDVSLFEGSHVSRVKLFFAHPYTHEKRRSELYGTTEFIADCGGLMGLFLGVSVVSVIEIFYFCTLRVFCNFKRQ